jgi:hypothetical protein
VLDPLFLSIELLDRRASSSQVVVIVLPLRACV